MKIPKINHKIVMFIAEILAVAALRAVYMIRRERVFPRAAKVGRMKGRPVYKPFRPTDQAPEIERDEPDEPDNPPVFVYKPPPRE